MMSNLDIEIRNGSVGETSRSTAKVDNAAEVPEYLEKMKASNDVAYAFEGDDFTVIITGNGNWAMNADEAFVLAKEYREGLAIGKYDPPAGSWAETAGMMADIFPDDGMDWDAWKDEMKEGDYS